MFGASQSFGYTQDAAPTQQAPKAARQEDKQTCVPVTVRILQDAVARHAETNEVLIHGTEAANVHVVGVVENLVQQSAMLEFTVNDASGRMKVRYYGAGAEGFAGLANGRYISIIGALRTSPTAHISAMNLQAVTAADDVSYHMIEVAHAALRLKNPTKAAPKGFTAESTPAKGLGLTLSSNTLSPAKVEAPVSFGQAPVSMHTPPKADLRSSVVDVMNAVKESAASEEGITISAIIGRLAGRDAPSDKVRSIMMALVDEGEVFNTIDDDHFAMI